MEPAAIAVDPLGNGVWEPLETAGVEPSWRNAGTAAATGVTGTGTAVGAFALVDGGAFYGGVSIGSTRTCDVSGDCYVARASGARPSTHWDVTLRETLSTPGGETKDWVLHIGASFDDVPVTDPFYSFVETLLHNGVTQGCGTTTYCPTDATTRAQMAVFVLKAAEGSGYTPPACVAGSELFGDIPAGNPFCPFIEELSRRGVVVGCGGGNYCPDDPTTRGQMPVFSLRTLEGASYSPPACVAGSEVFADVPATDPFCAWIEEYSSRGITVGCGGGNYCPGDDVTRGQMAVFQTKTFDLLIYGP
jgi:hypothetical protein